MPVETNRPKNETPHQCWEMLKDAHQAIKSAQLHHPVDREKWFQGIVDMREHQEHMGCKITPLSEFGITEQDVNDWIISDPIRTGKMLHLCLTTTISQEVKQATIAIREKYRKKLDEYRGNNRGYKK